mgnify:CR=1 FL=1
MLSMNAGSVYARNQLAGSTNSFWRWWVTVEDPSQKTNCDVFWTYPLILWSLRNQISSNIGKRLIRSYGHKNRMGHSFRFWRKRRWREVRTPSLYTTHFLSYSKLCIIKTFFLIGSPRLGVWYNLTARSNVWKPVFRKGYYEEKG